MDVNLLCSSSNKENIRKSLFRWGIEVVDKEAPIAFVEKGYESPNSSPVVVLFDYPSLSTMEVFIKDLISSQQNEKVSNDIILGCREESYELLKIEDVFYFKSENEFTLCQTEKDCFKVKLKLYEVERNFRNKGFIRINKSTVVNVLRINEVVPWFGGRILLRFDDLQDKLEVSRSYTKEFKLFLRM